MTPRRWAYLAVATIATGVALTGVLCAAFRAAQPRFDLRAYTKTWNDVGDSMATQDPLFAELQQNVKANPPGRIHSARRGELWDQIIKEQERQLKDFKALRAAER